MADPRKHILVHDSLGVALVSVATGETLALARRPGPMYGPGAFAQEILAIAGGHRFVYVHGMPTPLAHYFAIYDG